MKVFAHGSYRFPHYTRLIWRCGIALMLIARSVAPALACTPPPGGLANHHNRAARSGGRRGARGHYEQMSATNFQDDTATISVLRYFKGSGPATVTITGFGPGALCRSFVQASDHWIFFAKGDPAR